MSSFRSSRLIKADQVQACIGGATAAAFIPAPAPIQQLQPQSRTEPAPAAQAAQATAAALVNIDETKQRLLAAAVAQSQQLLEAARTQATEILREAQTQAAETNRQAQAQAAEITRQTQAQTTEVTRQARLEGLAAAESEVAQMLFSAHGMVDEVNLWREDMLTRSESLVLEVVADVARALFGQGITLSSADLQAALTRALVEARPLGDLRLHMHPDDAASLGQHWTEHQANRTNPGQKLSLVPDASIRRGGCLIEGDNGSVDARVDTQLQLALHTLTEVSATPAEDGAGLGEAGAR